MNVKNSSRKENIEQTTKWVYRVKDKGYKVNYEVYRGKYEGYRANYKVYKVKYEYI